MSNVSTSPTPDRAPVSIVERLIPAISFATAAIGGAVGAMLLRSIYSRLRSGETAGLDSLYIALARMNAVVGGILSFAAFVGLVALIIYLVRMFRAGTKASPPGFLLFVLGGFSLVPCILTGVGVYLLILSVAVAIPNIQPTQWIVSALVILSIVVACIMILLLGAFSFLSMSSRSGPKYSPFILTLLIEIALITAAVCFFSVIQFCLSKTSASFWH